jgi:hypothetical protein
MVRAVPIRALMANLQSGPLSDLKLPQVKKISVHFNRQCKAFPALRYNVSFADL